LTSAIATPVPFALPNAATISVLQTLALLDGPIRTHATGIIGGEYALWLGSGISRERVIGLDGVLRKLIEFLRTKIDPTNPDCPFKNALDNVLAKATLSNADKVGIDYGVDSATWPSISLILWRLAEQYSKVFDISLAGQRDDYLLWDATDFVNTFANQEPDAEHLLIGILILEGVVTELVSANWDGLLEAAMAELEGTPDLFRICVTGNDFAGPASAARLLKFHGCALRAIHDPSTYRPLLIVRSSQIVDWGQNNSFKAMRNELISVASRMRTLMIGMSAQDNNIQMIFSAARDAVNWPWSENPPPHVFAEQSLGDGQRTILKNSYRDDYQPNLAEIETRARIGAFGKPLLAALVLEVLCNKYCEMVRKVDAPLSPAARDALCEGLRAIRDQTAATAEPDRLQFVRKLIKQTARSRAILQDGEGSTGPKHYRPISARPIHLDINDGNLRSSGQTEAAVGAALLGLGTQAGYWQLSVDDPTLPTSGAARVTSAAGSTRIMFVAHDGADAKLIQHGIYGETDNDVVIVHSSAVVPTSARAPSGSLGRSGRARPRHVDMSKLLASATTKDELQSAFRREAVI
jgi:hypothetical protein